MGFFRKIRELWRLSDIESKHHIVQIEARKLLKRLDDTADVIEELRKVSTQLDESIKVQESLQKTIRKHTFPVTKLESGFYLVDDENAWVGPISTYSLARAHAEGCRKVSGRQFTIAQISQIAKGE